MTKRQNTRLVVVPMKDPALAKSRLTPPLSDTARSGLAVRLFEETLGRLNTLRANQDFDVAVVTHSPRISALSKSARVTVIDDSGEGLNAALQTSARWATQQGYTTICFLPADLAAPAMAELQKLLAYRLNPREIVLCPATDLGTNALLAHLPLPIELAYGDRSFLAHYRAAEEAGLTPVAAPWNSLKYDIDTYDDLLRRDGESQLP